MTTPKVSSRLPTPRERPDARGPSPGQQPIRSPRSDGSQGSARRPNSEEIERLERRNTEQTQTSRASSNSRPAEGSASNGTRTEVKEFKDRQDDEGRPRTSWRRSADEDRVVNLAKPQARPQVPPLQLNGVNGQSEQLQDQHFQTLCTLIEDLEARLMGHLTATCVQSIKASQLMSEQQADMEAFKQGVESKMVSLSTQNTGLKRSLAEFQEMTSTQLCQSAGEQEKMQKKLDHLLGAKGALFHFQPAERATTPEQDDHEALFTGVANGSPQVRGTPPLGLSASPTSEFRDPNDLIGDNLIGNNLTGLKESIDDLEDKPPKWYKKLQDGVSHVDHSEIIDAYQAARGLAEEPGSVDLEEVKDRVVKCGRSTTFAAFSAMMVLINALVIGLQADYEVNTALMIELCKDGLGPSPALVDVRFFKVMEWIFIVWMLLELILNVYSDANDPNNRWSDMQWNIFDGVVFVCSVANLVIMNLNLSAMRLARIGRIVKFVKLVRLLKVVKVMRVFRFLHAVRRMVLSMAGSINSLFWALFLLVLIMYILAILLVQGTELYITSKSADVSHPRFEMCKAGSTEPLVSLNITDHLDVFVLPLFSVDPVEHSEAEQLLKLYGSVLQTMLTLFSAISGGAEWAIVADPVAKIHPLFIAIWIFFISLMIFGVLNILTGIFVDAALSAAQNDRDSIVEQEIQDKESTINTLKTIFKKVDSDQSGSITMDEFALLMDNQEVNALLSHLELRPSEATGLFRLLDDDHSSRVSIDEFVNGCIRLKGGAKALDMISLMFEHKKMMRVVRSIKWDVQAMERAFGITPTRPKPHRPDAGNVGEQAAGPGAIGSTPSSVDGEAAGREFTGVSGASPYLGREATSISGASPYLGREVTAKSGIEC